MRAVVLFAWLVKVALGLTIGGGDSGGILVSRDDPAKTVVDKDFVTNEINLLLGSAKSGTTADDLTLRSNRIKSGALAELIAGGEQVSDEQSDAILKEMASKYPSVSTADLLNSDVLADEAYRVSAALTMLKECAEQIKTLQGKGEPYGPYIKAVIKLSDIIISSSRRVVDRYMFDLYNRAANKRNILRRSGPWTPGGNAAYNPSSGMTANGGLSYTGTHLNVGNQVSYSQFTGSPFNLNGSWSFG